MNGAHDAFEADRPDVTTGAVPPTAPSSSDAPARPAPGAWQVVTRTGSVYMIRVDHAGVWWLAADNATNRRSCRLADGEWRIDPPWPWPAVVGHPPWLLAPAELERDQPERIPGGGKITSDVVQVRSLHIVDEPGADIAGEERP